MSTENIAHEKRYRDWRAQHDAMFAPENRSPQQDEQFPLTDGYSIRSKAYILFGKKDIQVKQLMVFVYEDQKLMRSFLRNQCLNMTFNQQKTVSGLRRLLYQQNAKMRWTEASFFFQTVSLLKLNFIPMHLLCEHRIP